MSPSKKTWELTGAHIIVLLVIFFGVILVTNFIFVRAAVTSFRGEDVERSYRQGLEYNQTLETRKSQDALGWRASYNVVTSDADQARLILALKNSSSAALPNLQLTGKLRHPTDTKRDQIVSFTETKPGQYEMVGSVPVGKWQLRAVATNGQDTFNFQHDIWIE